MPAAPLPDDEDSRLAALNTLKILDTAPEGAFNEIAAVAADVCGAPIALVSLVDRERQWFKACVGLTVAQTHRNIAFCAYAILNQETFVVEDATQDPRFSDNPLVVGPPHIRSYAGAPITAPNGERVGTLCVIHTEVTRLTPRQLEHLKNLAQMVSNAMELRLIKSSISAGSKTVCVIDDDNLFRSQLVRQLRARGFNVVEAANAKVGLSLASDTGADVALVDVFMPDIDGIEAIKMFRKELPNVRLVALSGGAPSNGASYLDVARRMGATAVLGKQASIDELCLAING